MNSHVFIVAPWGLCVEFPYDFRGMERKVAEMQRRNVTSGLSRFIVQTGAAYVVVRNLPGMEQALRVRA